MEKKNDSKVISDREFITLLQAAKRNDVQAILQLIDLYKDDIMRISQYIYMSQEDAMSTIVLEFMEVIRENNDTYETE
ncbi:MULTISPECIES: helix-turn-helix domain-containing protein [Paenibacillus]|uniref:helix-turn-helix domain-containing protein n=1 Tax=Paenibacillus TaxID=44249 RepID=UPI00188D52BB|nr:MULTISPECIES: helix-turn-helix domain-containing protein [Paenibacillus]MBX4151110.1 helix-turn-helix domain-containing protein [Paenibacillus lautus]